MKKETATVTEQQSPADPDQLRADADRLAREAAEAFTLVQQAAADEAARAQERLAERARQIIADFDRAALDQAVDQARRDLDQTIRDWPITQALARYLDAQVARYEAVVDLGAAQSRLGLAGHGTPALPPGAMLDSLATYVNDTATKVAAQMTEERRNRQEIDQ